MKRASLLTLTLIGAFSAIQAAWAVDYPLPPTGSRLVGQNQTYTVQEGDKNLQAIYSAAIFLIPICISFDTAEKRRYATYLILNRRFSFEF